MTDSERLCQFVALTINNLVVTPLGEPIPVSLGRHDYFKVNGEVVPTSYGRGQPLHPARRLELVLSVNEKLSETECGINFSASLEALNDMDEVDRNLHPIMYPDDIEVPPLVLKVAYEDKYSSSVNEAFNYKGMNSIMCTIIPHHWGLYSTTFDGGMRFPGSSLNQDTEERTLYVQLLERIMGDPITGNENMAEISDIRDIMFDLALRGISSIKPGSFRKENILKARDPSDAKDCKIHKRKHQYRIVDLDLVEYSHMDCYTTIQASKSDLRSIYYPRDISLALSGSDNGLS